MPTIDPISELRVRPEELGARQINEMPTSRQSGLADAGALSLLIPERAI
jgi:hypothetical protein